MGQRSWGTERLSHGPAVTKPGRGRTKNWTHADLAPGSLILSLCYLGSIINFHGKGAGFVLDELSMEVEKNIISSRIYSTQTPGYSDYEGGLETGSLNSGPTSHMPLPTVTCLRLQTESSLLSHGLPHGPGLHTPLQPSSTATKCLALVAAAHRIRPEALRWIFPSIACSQSPRFGFWIRHFIPY